MRPLSVRLLLGMTAGLLAVECVRADDYPDLPPGKLLERGVRVHDVTLRRAGVPMRVWVYLPERATAGKLPCVLIAPAGTRLFHGIELGDGDRAEHVPYVRNGFAVVAYELDGTLPDDFNLAQAKAAISAFRDAGWGMANAKAAMDFAVAKVPQIDAARIFAVGHSSAATVALQLAAQEPRIAGCVAFAPACQIAEYFAGKPSLDLIQPGTMKALQQLSPDRNTEKLKCPTLLFAADDDDILPIASITKYAAQLQMTNKHCKLITVKTGGHYDSMIKQGIPAAITWLKGLKPVNPAGSAGAESDPKDDSEKLAQALIKSPSAKQSQLIEEYKNGKGAAYTEALVKAIHRLAGGMQDKARLSLVERLEGRTINTVRQYLEAEDPELRRAAAAAAGRKGKEEIAPDLIKLLKDADGNVVTAAHDALKRLSGKNLDKSPAAWEAWWKGKGNP